MLLRIGPGQGQEDALEVGMAEARGDGGRGVVGHHPPTGQEHHSLGEDLDLAHVVAGDQQRRAVGGAHVEQAGPHPLGHVRVERRSGLVEHEQAGSVQDRLGDADQGALARGQLVAHALGQVGDAEALEGIGDGGALVADAVEAGEDAERFLDPEPLGQRQVPGGEADVLHGLRATLGQAVATISIVPSSGVMAPRSISSVVVLPAPFGPRKPTRSPGATMTSTPLTAWTSPKRFTRPRASSTDPTGGQSSGRPGRSRAIFRAGREWPGLGTRICITPRP